MLTKLLKTLAAIFLLSFIVSSSVEGRVHSRAHPQISSVKKKVIGNLAPTKNLSAQKKKQVVAQKRPQRPFAGKRPQAQRALIAKRPPARKATTTQGKSQKTTPANKRPVVAKKTSPKTAVRAKPPAKRAALQGKKTSPAKTAPAVRPRRAVNPKAQHQYQQKTSLTQKRQFSQPAFKGSPRRQTPLAKKTPVNRNTPRKTDYLSLLPFHNQQNAKAGGLDKLLAKDMNGQGQTVAVIELSGEWQALKDAMNGKTGFLSPQIKANYKANFLTPIGGPGLHPEEKNDWLRDKDRICGGSPYHGSSVSSVVLDFAPQAKVLPVSTYYCHHTDRFYDTADALMDLSRRSDVSIINMSSGFIKFDVVRRNVPKTNGKEEELIKIIYPPKLIEAFKAVVKAGKVVVIGAGNEGKAIDIPQFRPSGQGDVWKELAGQLMQELDAEARQSIIVAGSYDRMNSTIASYSNKPGLLKNIQESFLLAYGTHVTNFAKNDDVAIGTSFAAPYVCAAIANLASKRNITPKRAVQALKETAERRPDVRTYGRGIIRADKALEFLERGY